MEHEAVARNYEVVAAVFEAAHGEACRRPLVGQLALEAVAFSETHRPAARSCRRRAASRRYATRLRASERRAPHGARPLRPQHAACPRRPRSTAIAGSCGTVPARI